MLSSQLIHNYYVHKRKITFLKEGNNTWEFAITDGRQGMRGAVLAEISGWQTWLVFSTVLLGTSAESLTKKLSNISTSRHSCIHTGHRTAPTGARINTCRHGYLVMMGNREPERNRRLKGRHGLTQGCPNFSTTGPCGCRYLFQPTEHTQFDQSAVWRLRSVD